MRLLISLGILVLGISFAVPVNHAFAQEEEASDVQESIISVAPAIFDLPVNRSQTYTNKIKITNDGADSVPITYNAQSLFVENTDGITSEDRQRFDASSWIGLPETAGVFAPDQTREVVFTVTVPEAATPGGHYATIIFQALTASGEVTVAPEIAVTLFMTVAGNIEESLKIEPQNFFSWFGTPKSVRQGSITVHNNGNVHLVVTPELVFTNGGEEKFVRYLSPQIVLPGLSRSFDEKYELPDERSGYRASVRLRYGDSRAQEVTLPSEQVIISYSFPILLTTATLTWLSLYVFRRRRHLKRVASVLRHGSEVRDSETSTTERM